MAERPWALAQDTMVYILVCHPLSLVLQFFLQLHACNSLLQCADIIALSILLIQDWFKQLCLSWIIVSGECNKFNKNN